MHRDDVGEVAVAPCRAANERVDFKGMPEFEFENSTVPVSVASCTAMEASPTTGLRPEKLSKAPRQIAVPVSD